MKKVCIFSLVLFTASTLFGQKETLDQSMIMKIRTEGLEHSQVMDIAFYLTDANGPRLNGSPGFKKAANWAKNKLAGWGLENSQLEPWGDWGKSWELEKSYLAMTAPYYRPLVAFPKAFTAGTNGLHNAEIIMVTAQDSIELQAWSGKLEGKIIIQPRLDTLHQSFKADANRYSDEELQKMSAFEPKKDSARDRRRPNTPSKVVGINTLKEFARREHALAILTAAPNGKDGTVFVQGGGSYNANDPEPIADLRVAYEDYMTLYRLAKSNIPVQVDIDVKTKFITDDLKGYNVVAEIKGSDPKLKDELVMIGAHLDSWQGATGATDNGAGSAVMLEAVRILKTLGVNPRRTIRIALWGGEEQGLWGSRMYVRNHFTDTIAKKANAEGEKLSVYFNLDNGTGKIRGVYMQGNENARPVFDQWLTPFSDLGATTTTLENTGGTDHLSFDRIGLPGFQFIQDEIEYNTRTHHTTMDSYDHLIADDLKQAATIVASFVYYAAQRDEKIPRKTNPKKE